jgi:hypothetical protein
MIAVQDAEARHRSEVSTLQRTIQPWPVNHTAGGGPARVPLQRASRLSPQPARTLELATDEYGAVAEQARDLGQEHLSPQETPQCRTLPCASFGTRTKP